MVAYRKCLICDTMFWNDEFEQDICKSCKGTKVIKPYKRKDGTLVKGHFRKLKEVGKCG
jgi:acetyl-CoA carboxylase beta subunit